MSKRPAAALEVQTARAAGLRYVTDQQPGIRRLGEGGHFRYLGVTGKELTDPATLKRLRALAIPPAWREVWICPDPRGHIQATGRDARHRKQYRYHADWREARDQRKFDRMIVFGRVLSAVRKRVIRDLRKPGLGRAKVLAALVRLLDLSAIRVGNDEYAQQNHTYGLTTLQDRHARFNGSTVRLQFRGKSGKHHALSINDPRLAQIMRQCQELPGQELFQWVDEEGMVHDVTSSDVNDYLLEATRQDFTTKDFRTWTGTVLAALALCQLAVEDSERRVRSNIVQAIKQVAERLGNTAAVCKKCYIHPAVFDSYRDGGLNHALRNAGRAVAPESQARLRPEEVGVLALLRARHSANGEQRLCQALRKSIRQAKRRPRP